MAINCFGCKKADNCIEYEICDKGSKFEPINSDKEVVKKQCSTCNHKELYSDKCRKTPYPRSGCINQNYKLWEIKKNDY